MCLRDSISLDRACFAELMDLAKRTGSAFLLEYIRHGIDCANLRTVVRGVRLGRDAGFLLRAQAPGGYVNPERLCAIALGGGCLLYTSTNSKRSHAPAEFSKLSSS